MQDTSVLLLLWQFGYKSFSWSLSLFTTGWSQKTDIAGQAWSEHKSHWCEPAVIVSSSYQRLHKCKLQLKKMYWTNNCILLLYIQKVNYQFLVHMESHSQILKLFILSQIVLKNYYVILILKRPKTWQCPVPSRLLKGTAHYVASSFILQSLINQEKLPAEWRDANLIPVYKKGSRVDATNYRPTSLTSIYCKILKHMYNTFLYTFSYWQ